MIHVTKHAVYIVLYVDSKNPQCLLTVAPQSNNTITVCIPTDMSLLLLFAVTFNGFFLKNTVTI